MITIIIKIYKIITYLKYLEGIHGVKNISHATGTHHKRPSTQPRKPNYNESNANKVGRTRH